MLPKAILWAPLNQCLTVYVFLQHTSLYHLIWQMLSPCSLNCGNPSFGNLEELSLSSSSTSLSSPWDNDELLLMEITSWFISQESYSVIPSICVAPFFSGILSPRYPDTNQNWISVRYDGWDNFPRVMMLILWWPGNMMSCLAPPPPGWRTYHYRFLFSKVIHSPMRKL